LERGVLSSTRMLGPTGRILERYLDVLAVRQRVAASNIANADTPGYRAREVDFSWHLETIAVRETWGEGAKNDGNNVQLDGQLRALADNNLRFSIASALLQKQIRAVRNAIREGRGGV
jgi:flagellar basal-body rod protein FlgB